VRESGSGELDVARRRGLSERLDELIDAESSA
jgi:hypothetical protein